ncbi:MAG: (E)-4-hydroxy-3-methylbut-2-enyl-diphosphate synthase [Bacteroidales bacterium]|nr:(E)-4-hydroxy-3-methylbut-2-enyl-diphosphate synthase [Bacteroidales bacterium]MCF8389609.1 (E)-4-hydroxy-3-methylbut-2-enyl-diphosphate synthase [Bacteroidales bacterium]
MFQSKKIQIGNIELGGDSPIVLQSMTSTDTNNIEATVEECIRIFNAGGQMVRITTQSLKEVISLKKIREELHKRNYTQPLVADVHFLPKVAEEAAKIVEKVRINPGNYLERKYEGSLKFSVQEQRLQAGKIRERLVPLIRICMEHNTAIRIGVNHGSLSERMMNWYGDTPQGMVESALEFIRIFDKENFQKLVISIKSSNTRTMVFANRLLMKRMYEEGFSYPVHLGVTEAGDAEDGRIKSTIGIGGLLFDGIGDTIRVSLTEDPEKEIPVAKQIVNTFGNRARTPEYILKQDHFFNPFEYNKRLSLPTESIGGKNVPVVIAGSGNEEPTMEYLSEMGYLTVDKGNIESLPQAANFIFIGNNHSSCELKAPINLISDFNDWREKYSKLKNHFPLIEWKDYGLRINDIFGLNFIAVDVQETPIKFYEIIENDLYASLIIRLSSESTIQHAREFFRKLGKIGCLLPVILYKKFNSKNKEELLIKAATEFGSLLNDGYGDGLWIEDENPEIPDSFIRELSFNILQATGTRITKTEYISCPSCGRTLFKIQDILKKIKDATSEFKGLKIGVMGCIVNGPGEMADADFGYVGAGPGLVTLYKGREAVKKNIPEEKAVEELVMLIRNSTSK